MKPNPVGWFEIYVDDMARARGFYEHVFSTTLQCLSVDGIEMFAFAMSPEASGASGALIRAPGVRAGQNSTVVYFSCEDCAVEGARVSGGGGTVERGKMSIGQYGFVVLARDTEGNLIGLHSMA